MWLQGSSRSDVSQKPEDVLKQLWGSGKGTEGNELVTQA